MTAVNTNRMLLLFAVVFATLWLWNFVRKALAVRSAARRILGSLRMNFSSEHELQVVQVVPEETRAPLDAITAMLDPLGLRPVCDFEDVAVNRSAGLSIPMRAFASASEPISALAYHHPKLGRTLLEVSSKLSDGRTLTTTTAVEATKLANPPELERQAMPPDTAPAAVVASHRDWLAKALASTTGIEARALRSPDEVLAEARRLQRLKHEHRKRIGWITFEEMVTMAHGREDVARLTYAAIERELAREHRRGVS